MNRAAKCVAGFVIIIGATIWGPLESFPWNQNRRERYRRTEEALLALAAIPFPDNEYEIHDSLSATRAAAEPHLTALYQLGSKVYINCVWVMQEHPETRVWGCYWPSEYPVQVDYTDEVPELEDMLPWLDDPDPVVQIHAAGFIGRFYGLTLDQYRQVSEARRAAGGDERAQDLATIPLLRRFYAENTYDRWWAEEHRWIPEGFEPPQVP